MTTSTTTVSVPLLLITADPSHPLARLALRYARAYLQHASNQDNDDIRLNIFFYGDAAHTANRLRWQSADQCDLTKGWQSLAAQYQLSLPVCVSTALSRGISDTDNSKRHQLDAENLATGFQLVGLSELVMMMQKNCRLMQF